MKYYIVSLFAFIGALPGVSAAAWIASGPDGGDVHDVTAAAGKLYIATNDGPYVSTDDGMNWSRLGDLPHGLPVATVAVDPGNASNLLLGVGAGSSPAGGAIYRSTDGGAHWVAVGPAADRLVFHPLSPADVIGTDAFNRQLRRSSDGGATWATGPGAGSPVSVFATAVAADGNNARTFYAIDIGRTVSRSIDGGNAWNSAGAGFGESASGASTFVVISGGPRPVLVWNDNFEWPFGASIRRYEVGNPSGGYSFALNEATSDIIVADPFDATRLWFTAQNSVQPTGHFLYRSTGAPDGWSLVGSSAKLLAADRAVHNVLFGVDARGFARSADAGLTWQSRTRGVPLAKTAAVAFRPGSANEILAVGASFGAALSADGGASWQDSGTGLASASINALARTATEPGLVYAGSDDGLFRSADGGRTWARVQIAGFLPGMTEKFIALDVDRDDPHKLVAIVGVDTLAWSSDGGVNWQPAQATNATRFNRLPRSTSGTRKVYARSSGNVLYRAGAHGAVFEPTGTQIVEAFDVDHAGDPADDDRVVALTYDGVEQKWTVRLSADGGASWELRGLLASSQLPTVRFSPCDASVLYAFGGGSLQTSIDQGATWSMETPGPALAPDGGNAGEIDVQCLAAGAMVAVPTASGGVRVLAPDAVDGIFSDSFDP